jgi:hypothetical protein
MAAQLTSTKLLPARGDRAWIARATTSLPVPLSPLINMVASVLATRSISARSRTVWGCSPISARAAGE